MISEIRKKLLSSQKYSVQDVKRFFKTGPGEYSEHDQFLGVPVPALRKIAKLYSSLPYNQIQTLMSSRFNEERMLALLILVNRFQINHSEQDYIYKFYLKNIKQVNNWNLVDASAHHIVGAYLFNRDKSLLDKLSASKILWERRIAIVSTWYFLRNKKFTQTKKIAKLLFTDKEDLIHKATGWMLREMGKYDENYLINFLEKHAIAMPRTMLRYSIERLPDALRKKYLKMK